MKVRSFGISAYKDEEQGEPQRGLSLGWGCLLVGFIRGRGAIPRLIAGDIVQVYGERLSAALNNGDGGTATGNLRLSVLHLFHLLPVLG